MNVQIIKANYVDLTDSDTGMSYTVLLAGQLPEFHYSQVEGVTETYLECPVVNGEVVYPDGLMKVDESGYYSQM